MEDFSDVFITIYVSSLRNFPLLLTEMCFLKNKYLDILAWCLLPCVNIKNRSYNIKSYHFS